MGRGKESWAQGTHVIYGSATRPQLDDRHLPHLERVPAEMAPYGESGDGFANCRDGLPCKAGVGRFKRSVKLLLPSSSWATCGHFCLSFYSYSGSQSWLFTVATVGKSARPPGGLPCTGTAAALVQSIYSVWPGHLAGSTGRPTGPRSPVPHLLVWLGRKNALVLPRLRRRTGLQKSLGPM